MFIIVVYAYYLGVLIVYKTNESGAYYSGVCLLFWRVLIVKIRKQGVTVYWESLVNLTNLGQIVKTRTIKYKATNTSASVILFYMQLVQREFKFNIRGTLVHQNDAIHQTLVTLKFLDRHLFYRG